MASNKWHISIYLMVIRMIFGWYGNIWSRRHLVERSNTSATFNPVVSVQGNSCTTIYYPRKRQGLSPKWQKWTQRNGTQWIITCRPTHWRSHRCNSEKCTFEVYCGPLWQTQGVRERQHANRWFTVITRTNKTRERTSSQSSKWRAKFGFWVRAASNPQ